MNSNVRALYYFSFFNSFRMHWPVAIVYFREITGSYAAAMTIFSVVFLFQALCEVPAGALSDTTTRRATMIVGAACASASVFFYAVAPSFAILLVGGLFEGMSRAVFSGTDTAILVESLSADERAEKLHAVLGKMSAMSQLALCLSAALCAVLSRYSLQLVFWLSIAPQIFSFIAALFLYNTAVERAEPSHMGRTILEALRTLKNLGRLRLLALAEVVDFGVGESIFYFQGALFESLVPLWSLGIVRCANHLIGFMGFWFAGSLVGRFGA